MRIVLSVFILAFGFSNAWADDVILVSILGKKMAPRIEDFNAVNAKIGSLIADFKLKSFEIVAYGTEGGYAACLQPQSNIMATVIESEMKSVGVDPKVTSYSVSTNTSCK